MVRPMVLVLAAGVLLAGSTAALAADCGTGVGPCSCGDHVVTSTQLKASVDSVAVTVCSGGGLTVASGVTLNVGGNKLRGDGTGPGILIDAGSSSVVITNGTVKNFDSGIIGVATSTTVSRMVVTDTVSGIPIGLVGDSNQFRKNVVQRCSNTGGVVAVGANPVIANNVVADCGAVAVVGATGSAVSRNDVRRSSSFGIAVIADSSSVSENFVASSSSFGIAVVGTANSVVRNDSRRNGDAGIAAANGANILDQNNVDHNASHGLAIAGSGSSATGNVATSNGSEGILSSSGNCSFGGNTANGNVGDGLLAVDGGAGPDHDLGGNSGSGNGGVQCEIDGVSCL